MPGIRCPDVRELLNLSESSVLAGFVLDGVRLSVEQGHYILCFYMFLIASNAGMLDVVFFVNFVISVLYTWATWNL